MRVMSAHLWYNLILTEGNEDMKNTILRTVTVVTTTVQTVKTTTKDTETYVERFDGEREYETDTRVDSLNSWERDEDESDDE